MKKYCIILTTVLFIIPVFLSAQMEIIIISNPVFEPKSRSSVKFGHTNHMSFDGVSCTDCHHRYEKGINVLDVSELAPGNRSIRCINCHSDPSKLKKGYHRLCIRCHESMVKKNKTPGPRLCGECHK